MELKNFFDVAQAGAVVMLCIAVYYLWQRLNKVTDAFLDYLRESAKRGDVAAQIVREKRPEITQSKNGQP